jgi:acyl-CoA thioesterase-2
VVDEVSGPDVDLRALLTLEAIERDLFRAGTVYAEEYDLYGGQVAAQALMAAGRTVDPDRRPHSLHGNFLRRGDPSRPTVFRVYRDRDGRSFSARRVAAVQQGEVIFTVSTSFHTARDGWSSQVAVQPEVPAPDELPPARLPRLFSMDARIPVQPWPDARWPTRFWARVSVPLADDPLVHACALTYLSDISTGVLPSPDGSQTPESSLDHAVWFHDSVDMTGWTLSEYRPQVTGHGRGWYNGSLFAEDGRLVASIAQECLFR